MAITNALLEVAKRRARGLTEKEVAQDLSISPIATRRRAGRIVWETDSRNMTEAVYKLTKQGLICILIASQVALSSPRTSSRHSRNIPRTRVELSV